MSDENPISLDYLFKPQTVAMFGASERFEYFFTGLKQQNFDHSNLYLINPRKEEVFGMKCYKSVSDLPVDTIDHLIIAVGRGRIIQSLKDMLTQKKIRTIHIFTAGLGESDEEGLVIEKELYDIINGDGVKTRFLGPNCMGVYSVPGHLSYEEDLPTEPGNISLVFQSGDLHSQVLRVSHNRYDLKFSKGVSCGNCLDLQISDFLHYYNNDKDTDLVGVYFEGFSKYHKNEGKTLLNTLKAMKKPVLFINGGSTDRSQKAALSHTGSIGTNQNIWKGIVKQTPVINVPTSLDDLVDYFYLFDKVIKRYKQKNEMVIYPKGKNALLVLWSGGFGIIDTNTLTEIGLKVPYFEGEVLEKLMKIHPIVLGSVKNPLDLPWISGTKEYVDLAKVAIAEGNIDIVMIETGASDDYAQSDFFKRHVNNLIQIKDFTESLNKIFVLILPNYRGKVREMYFDMLGKEGFITFPSVRRAGKAFLALHEYGRKIKRFNTSN